MTNSHFISEINFFTSCISKPVFNYLIALLKNLASVSFPAPSNKATTWHFPCFAFNSEIIMSRISVGCSNSTSSCDTSTNLCAENFNSEIHLGVACRRNQRNIMSDDEVPVLHNSVPLISLEDSFQVYTSGSHGVSNRFVIR